MLNTLQFVRVDCAEEYMHLIIDGYGSDPRIMQDEPFLHEMLDTFPSSIGMTKISETCTFKYTGGEPQDWGISGFVVIAESHISFHTFVERCFINMDIFSCRDFDAEKATRYVVEKLKLTRIKCHLLNRDRDISEFDSVDQIKQLQLV
jgi:S-adenosylmethionine decarboxylase